MRNLNIIFCVLLAVSHMLNIGLIIFLHANGRRLSGVIISMLKVVTFMFTALMLQAGQVPPFDPLVTWGFCLFTIGAMRRSWLMIHLFREKENNFTSPVVN